MAILEASGVVRPAVDSDTLKVKLVHPNAVLPTRAHQYDAGLDLYSVSDMVVDAGGKAIVSTGLCVQIPRGYVGLVYIRSSVGFKHNVTLSNSVGVIDSSYRGEVKVALTNHSKATFYVAKGDRVAQLVLTPISLLRPVAVAELDETSRGDGGIGSSGV